MTAYCPRLKAFLPPEITFVTTQELEDRYPGLTPSGKGDGGRPGAWGGVSDADRGEAALRGAHDGRAPDYDDWSLNGDIFFYYPVLERASLRCPPWASGWTRSLAAQLKEAGCGGAGGAPFQKALARRAAADHRWWHRPVPAVHVFPSTRPTSARCRPPCGRTR